MAFEEVQIGDCRLIRADNRDVYDALPKDAAIVSDVPYGMQWDTQTARFSGGHNPAMRGVGRHDAAPILGDTEPFDPSPWLGFRQAILWGSNHFAQRLPVGTTLVWIKRLEPAFGSFLSDAEVAWMQGGHGVYCYRDLSMNALTQTRQHPCEKPVGLLRWCVAKTTGTVMDPYAGVFTTAIAALQLGRQFIGCEVDERYFDIGCRRVEAAYQQLALFPPPVPPVAAQQQGLFQ